MNICLIGDLDDLTLIYVGWTARQAGHNVIELAEDTLGDDWSVELQTDAPDEGWLRWDGGELRLSDIDGAYVRLHSQPKLPRGVVLNPAQTFWFVSERRCAVQFFLEHLTCPVVNRTFAGRANGSKPHQMRLLSAAGFRVPRWIVSNDLQEVSSFARECPNGVIYKAASGLRARVRRLDDELNRKLAEGTTPVLVQEYIPGVDVRIHTVAREAFATQICGGEGVDYRFESDGRRYTATTPPPEVAALCFDVAEREGLMIGGFDFRVTETGDWWCLEVNPVPTFLPYEMSTGQPIAAAILSCFGREKHCNDAGVLANR